MSTAAMTNGFAANAVFLVGERQGDKCGGKQVGRRAGQGVETVMPNPDADVLHAEAIIGSREGGATVLAGTEEEKISQEEAIPGGREPNGRKQTFVKSFPKYNEGQRFDTGRRRVRPFPRPK